MGSVTAHEATDAGATDAGATDSHAPVPLARLFAMAYRWMLDELHRRLATQGWEGIRPAYGFVLLALRAGPIAPTQLASKLEISKQAASKLVEAMVEADLVARTPDEMDRRRHQLVLAPRGRKLLTAVERIYDELEREWAEVIGVGAIEETRTCLTEAMLAMHTGTLPTIRPVDLAFPTPTKTNSSASNRIR